jgi:hypothetical protein
LTSPQTNTCQYKRPRRCCWIDYGSCTVHTKENSSQSQVVTLRFTLLNGSSGGHCAVSDILKKKKAAPSFKARILIIITCRLVLDIRAHMYTGSDVTHGPHIRTALPIEHRKWALMEHNRRGGQMKRLAETCLKTACANRAATFASPG